MSPEISIIVPHLNQPDLLETLLVALAAQTIHWERMEVIVIDNGSRELPRAVVERFPGSLLAVEPTAGPGPARNRGVALARAPILAFIDADCRPETDWVERILARFEADPALDIIGGDVRVFPADYSAPTVAEAYDALYAFRQQHYITRQGFSVTANLATRQAVHNAVGPFAGIAIAEDTDWGQRAGRLGYRTVYAPEVVVHHPARRSLAELYIKWDRNMGHHFTAYAGTPLGKVKWLAKAAALAVSPIGEVPYILRSDRVAGVRMRWQAFGALSAVRLYRTRRMLELMIRPTLRTSEPQWNR